MTGSIQVKSGHYYAVLNLKGQDGKRKQKWVSTGLPVKNNKRRAEVFLQQELRKETLFSERQAGNYSNALFCDFMEQWLKQGKDSLSETTYASYYSIVYSAVLPYFESMRLTLRDVKPFHIQAFYQYEMEEKKCSGNTVRHHHSVLNCAFAYAARAKLLLENPMDGVICPRKKRYTGGFYTAVQLRQLFSAVQGSNLETPVLLAGCYGLRRSEVLGLRWSGVDFAQKSISVTGSVVEVAGQPGKNLIVRDVLKTDSSYRTLPLLPQVEQYLFTLNERQKQNRKSFGEAYSLNYLDYLCVNEKGELLHPNYVTKQFPRLLALAGLPPIRFHDLRHSCATLLVGEGAPLKAVQVWLGHSSFQTTADIYAHVQYRDKVPLAELLTEKLPIDSLG